MEQIYILKDEMFLPAAVSLICGAKKCIWIANFKIEICLKKRGDQLTRLFANLAAQVRKQTCVRVLTNKQVYGRFIPTSNALATAYLKKSGIHVRALPKNRICHAKLLIVDHKIAIVGSHNLSVKSCHNNFELSCYVSDIDSVTYLSDTFNNLWHVSHPI